MGEVGWEALLGQASRLRSTAMDTDLPSMRRNLHEIERISDTLRQKSVREADQSSQRTENAKHMLMKGGFDAARLSRALQRVNLKKTFEPLDVFSTTDIQAFLRHEYELAVTTVIEEAEKNAIAAFQDNMARSLEQDWKAEKKHILQLLSTQPAALPQRQVQVSDAAQQSGVLGGLAAVYASAVKALNTQKDAGRNACKVFYDKISASDVQDPMLRTCWKYLRFIEGVKNAQGGQGANMAQVAQQFLQDDYRDVQFGGGNVLGDLENKSHSMAWQHIDEPDRQWAVVYYCLRAGFGTTDRDRRDLLAYVREKQATFGAPFIDQLDAYLRGEHVKPWRSGAAANKDGRYRYRWIVENVVAREHLSGYCRDDKRVIDVVNSDIETRLWHMLNSYQTVDKLSEPDLESVREMASMAPNELRAFYVLLLAGQFRQAISTLENSRYHVDAVHFAMVMSRNRLHLLDDDAAVYVEQYIRTFLKMDYISYALHYLEFLGDGAKSADKDRILEHMGDDVPVQYMLRLLDPHFYRQEGLTPDPEWLASRTAKLGERKEDQGLFVDGVLLFQRAAERCRALNNTTDALRAERKVLNLLIRQLSDALNRDPRDIENLPSIHQASALKEHYQSFGNPLDENARLREQFLLLWKYVEFYHWYGKEQYEHALRLLDDLQVLPTTQAEVNQKVATYVSQNNDGLANATSILLQTTMELLYKLYKAEKPYNNKKAEEIQERARALMMLSGHKEVNVPRDVQARLVELEIAMR